MQSQAQSNQNRSASTTTSPSATETVTSQSGQDPSQAGRQPISDEAFTQLVSGITGYMSQAAMGQAPRQTIGDFLRNMGDSYSLPQGEGRQLCFALKT